MKYKVIVKLALMANHLILIFRITEKKIAIIGIITCNASKSTPFMIYKVQIGSR